LEFGALEIQRSWPEPLPNVGPVLLSQQIAFPSLPDIKGIFVGGRPLGLTRLNRNEPGAFFPQTPETNKEKKYLRS